MRIAQQTLIFSDFDFFEKVGRFWARIVRRQRSAGLHGSFLGENLSFFLSMFPELSSNSRAIYYIPRGKGKKEAKAKKGEK